MELNESESEKPGEWSRFVRQLVIVLLILGALTLIRLLSPLWNLLAWTAIFILVLSFPIRFIRKKTRLPPLVAVIAVILPCLLLMVALSFYPIRNFLQSFQLLVAALNQETTIDKIAVQNLLIKISQDPFFSKVIFPVTDSLGNLFSFGAHIFTYAWTAFLLAVVFFLEVPAILDKALVSLSGTTRREVGSLVLQISQVWDGWMRSTVIVSFIVGFLTGLELYLFGIPYAWQIGLLAGLLNLVPTIGPLITYLLIIFVTYTLGSTKFDLSPVTLTILVWAINLLSNQFCRLYLYPKLAGKSIKLPVFLILLAIFAGAMIWGVAGVILCIPLVGTLRVVVVYLMRKISLQDPFPDEQINDQPFKDAHSVR